MYKNKILLLVLLIVVCTNSFSQSLANKTQREYFILGTLSDYIGRYLDPRDTDLVDRYWANERPLIIFLDSLLKIDYPVSSFRVKLHEDSLGNLINAKIFSDTLFKNFNTYYKFKPSGSLTTEGDTIYYGVLKDNIFKKDEQKLAFIAGTYVRFGIQNDTSYAINIANSASKANVCYKLLKEFDCKPNYEILHNIPVMHRVYFHPTKYVMAYLQEYMYLRNKIDQELKLLFDRMETEQNSRKSK